MPTRAGGVKAAQALGEQRFQAVDRDADPDELAPKFRLRDLGDARLKPADVVLELSHHVGPRTHAAILSGVGDRCVSRCHRQTRRIQSAGIGGLAQLQPSPVGPAIAFTQRPHWLSRP